MKRFLKGIVLNKPVASLLIKPVLFLHSCCYKWAGRFAIVLNDGVHPKHRILRYKEWFVDNVSEGWTILDVGCNTGMLSLMLAEKASFVYGIEANEKHLAVAKTKYARDNIEYICADATDHDYSSCRPINCVILSNVLEHFEHRVDFLKKIICQIKWADENDKCILLRVPIIDREWIVLYKKEQGLDYRLDSTHCIEYTLEQVKEELKQANIEIKQVDIRFGEIYAVCRVKSD